MRRPFTRMSVAVDPRLRMLMLALSPRAPDEPRRVSFSGRFTTEVRDVRRSTGRTALRVSMAVWSITVIGATFSMSRRWMFEPVTTKLCSETTSSPASAVARGAVWATAHAAVRRKAAIIRGERVIAGRALVRFMWFGKGRTLAAADGETVAFA